MLAAYKADVANADPIGAFVNDNVMVTAAAFVAEDREDAVRSMTNGRLSYLQSNVFRYHDTFPRPDWAPAWPELIPDPTIERQREAILLQGDLPSPANPPTGCRFHTRCPFVQPTRCRDEVPGLRELAPGHGVACHWAEQIEAGAIKMARHDVVEAAPDDTFTPSTEQAPTFREEKRERNFLARRLGR